MSQTKVNSKTNTFFKPINRSNNKPKTDTIINKSEQFNLVSKQIKHKLSQPSKIDFQKQKSEFLKYMNQKKMEKANGVMESQEHSKPSQNNIIVNTANVNTGYAKMYNLGFNKHKKIGSNDLINSQQFQDLFHSTKDTHQQIVHHNQKQQLDCQEDQQSQEIKGYDKEQKQIRQEINRNKQEKMNYLRQSVNIMQLRDKQEQQHSKDSGQNGEEEQQNKKQRVRRKDSVNSQQSRASNNIDKVKRKSTLDSYLDLNSMSNHNSIFEKGNFRYSQKSFKEFKKQKEQQKMDLDQDIEIEDLNSQQIIERLNLKQNQQTQSYYSVENVFKQRIYDDIDICNFVIGEQIGSGKYSKCYVCHLNNYSKQWAMKVIRKYDIRKQEIDMEKQIKIMRTIKNSNVARLWFCLEDKNNVYLVTDLLEMKLSDYLKQQADQLSEKHVRNIFRKVMNGLQGLHQNNVGHLNLTLDSVYIDSDCQRLMIKGLRFAQTDIDKHKMNIFYQEIKPHFSPELANKQFYNADKQDVWSVGVILYQLLFQKIPFKGKKESQMLVQINIANYKLDDEISESLKNLFFHIFRVQQEKRYSVQDIIKHRWMQVT